MAAVLACALLLLFGFGASHAGSRSTAGEANPELRSLERRAQAGDKQAQLELGIRYEEGRDVPRDPEKAGRLYRRNLSGTRFQTQSVPSGGGVRPENTAIGEPPVWPRSYADRNRYHPSRIPALLRWCGLRPQSGASGECEAGKLDLLRRLAQFESSFRPCRVTANLGNAARSGPHSFNFIAEETDRRMATRRCLLDSPVPDSISGDQSSLVWTMWLALSRCGGSARADECDRAAVRRQFSNALRTHREDSLMWFAMREALRRNPSMEDQVGDSWWWHLCNFASPDEPRIEATDAETKMCNLIKTLVLTA
jgi:hypothetical protein